MLHFGFSYVGLIYLLMLFIPNIIWTKYKPKDYEKYAQIENKILQIIEKTGEVLVCCCVLIFSDFNIKLDSEWCIFLLISFMLMLLYEVYWIRYFRSEKNMSDFYRSICGIPVAGATLPVCAFFLLGVYGSNIFLIISTIILGIGHIGIHLNHYKKITEGTKKKNIMFRIVKWVTNIICIILVSITIVIIGCRNFNYINSGINSDRGVNEGIYVTLGGQEQYLLIHGGDTTNPVIIWLHGGPSSPDTFVNYIFQKHLVEDYTIINWDQRGCGSYEDALEKAIAMGDDTQEMEAAYQKYMEDKSLVNMMNLRNHTSKYHVAEKSANTIWEGITSPYMGVDDARWFLRQAGKIEDYIALNEQLFNYIMETDVRDYGLEYKVPVGFITGADDWTTPVKYAEDYCNIISAPKKQFALVEGCGHMPQYDSPEEFCSVLKSMLDEYVN